MEYCLGDGDGSATMWTAAPDVDLDGDGRPDAVGLDFDGDGRLDDVMADLDGDGLAEQAALDLDDDDRAEAHFTDDGSGTWLLSVDRAGQVRWFGLDGAEQVGGPLVDVDADGEADDRLADSDGNGLADRAFSEGLALVDTDADGRWDVRLTDSDGDGKADAATEL
ncbi:pullulanase [Mycolicibacterium arseniciresistens]|uniref:Pullulanase n=1 Tax=Mycolicibacterium arseniciresistens TaxID=3062257 RepID=A0ABT8UMZ9_9MYCO|nr:pullulanase [Mycolicibacterium arseniciresistens]MDO3639185.1 pullulanase [Mycolicibacterium arseniciresistens]